MLTVGCPMSTSPGVPRGPLLLLGWDHTGKPSIPLQAPWHKVFLQAESQSLLAGDESAFLAGKKKKKTQPTTLLFWGGLGRRGWEGRLCQWGGLGSSAWRGAGPALMWAWIWAPWHLSLVPAGVWGCLCPHPCPRSGTRDQSRAVPIPSRSPRRAPAAPYHL